MAQGRIPTSIWRDREFSELEPTQQTLLLGLISLSTRRGRVLGSHQAIRAKLDPYGQIEDSHYLRDFYRLARAGLIGIGSEPGRYISIDLNYEPKARVPLSKRLREAVIKRDGMVCQLCGGEIPSGDLHIDHIYPVALGGGDELDNLQAAHSRCNISKGSRV